MDETGKLLYRLHHQTNYLLALEWHYEVLEASRFARNKHAVFEVCELLGEASIAVQRAKELYELYQGYHHGKG